MSKRAKYIVREVEPATPASTNLIIGFVAGILFGGLSGYILGAQALPGRAATTSAAVTQVAAVTPPLPSNPVDAGNQLYDQGKFNEAIPYYEKALAMNPKDINVSTDLGTSLWNLDRTDEALKQFEKSLAINPTHAQTLFNVGIVKLNGKHDAAGAIAAWEKLLASNPAYPEAAKVRQLIADARKK